MSADLWSIGKCRARLSLSGSLLAAAPATASVDDSHPAALRRPSVERCALRSAISGCPCRPDALRAYCNFAAASREGTSQGSEEESSHRSCSLPSPRALAFGNTPHNISLAASQPMRIALRKDSAQLHGLCSALWRASVRPIMMQE